MTIETPHYIISSSATPEQTKQVARLVEALYTAYSNRFASLPSFRRNHPKLRLLLYKDRREFRRANPNLGWVEAFYRDPYCRAYYSAKEINPCHWMLHEAVHQLNHEVARVHLAKWLEEGLATYFSTSLVRQGRLAVGEIDPNTYPVWWMDEIATTPSLATNLANGSVIPLRAILLNRGGPSLNREFNLYYLHWWTLTYFIFQSEKYRGSALALVQAGGDIKAFERLIGPLDRVEVEWHAYVRRMKAALGGKDMEFYREMRSRNQPRVNTGGIEPEIRSREIRNPKQVQMSQ